MNSKVKQLHHLLELVLYHHQGIGRHEPQATGDSAVEELVALAQALKTAPQLQVDPNFAHRLEQRLLMHHRARQREHSADPGKAPASRDPSTPTLSS